jgi:UDP-galactopyranose mutase
MQCDVLIVGAGFAGLVLAERLSNGLGKHCIVVDKRRHIGGNAYDRVDSAGVLVHQYGPHFFHTNSEKIFQYLSRFTDWIPAHYSVASFSRGRLWSFPVNLKTFEQLIGRPSTTAEMQEYLHRVRVPNRPANAEEAIVSQVGWELYDMFYKGYTTKQWGRSPKELDASVCLRVPIRTTRDDRYFNDTYQCMPAHSYSKMFETMVKCSPKVELLLGTDYKTVRQACRYRHLVYTGCIDEFFDYAYGPLPYRTLRFEHESLSKEYLRRGFWQSTCAINYPNDHAYTRCVEIKHATGQYCPNTTLVREYPATFAPGSEPFYPIPSPDAAAIYEKYKFRAFDLASVSFVGRLATYRYLNMDQVVGSALSEYEKLRAVL